MTTTHICRISASEGQTATAKRFDGTGSSDTVRGTAVSVIEQTNDKGTYLVTFEDQAAGYSKIKLFSVASGRALSEGFCTFAGTNGEVLECGVGVAELDTATQDQLDDIETAITALNRTQLAAITVESGVIGNFPETLTIGDSYTSNTGQIKIAVTDSDGDPITTFGSLALEDAIIEFTAFRPNDSAVITGTCEFVDDVTETYVLLTLSSIQTSLGVAEYTYEGRLKFFWEGAVSSDSLDSDDEQKTYKTTPFKFISNP